MDMKMKVERKIPRIMRYPLSIPEMQTNTVNQTKMILGGKVLILEQKGKNTRRKKREEEKRKEKSREDVGKYKKKMEHCVMLARVCGRHENRSDWWRIQEAESMKIRVWIWGIKLKKS